MFRLNVLAGCFLEQEGRRLDEMSGQRKALALLTILVATGERGVTRDTIITYLWPEKTEERGRTSLRQLVHLLRTQLDAPDLFLSSADLRLNPAIITSDLTELRDALADGNLEAALTLYAGPFLDGFYLAGADTFERWVSTERDRVARTASQALQKLAHHKEAQGFCREAVDVWRRLTQIEPLGAQAAIGLMRSLESAGERAAALQHARNYELLIREEFGGQADDGVTQFAEELRRRDTSLTKHRVNAGDQSIMSENIPLPSRQESRDTSPQHIGISYPRPFPRKFIPAIAILITVTVVIALWQHRISTYAGSPMSNNRSAATSIAVLPFSNTSGARSDEPLSDGLTDELINALATVSGVRVIGRTSSFAFKARGLEGRAIARDLGVTHLLEGSVRRAGTRIRVNAQLISAADGSVVWAQEYNQQLDDLLDVQDKIAGSIVKALRGRVAGTGSALSLPPGPTDRRACEAYLRGRHILTAQTTGDAAIQAERYFKLSLSYDSAYAKAYAGISDVHTRLAVFGFEPAEEGFAKSKSAAQRALALDTTSAEAYASLAHALCVGEFNWKAAEEAFRRATALRPSYTFARLPFAICLGSQGRFREAMAQLDTAHSYDPLAPAISNVRGWLYVSMRQPDEAIRYLNEALELNPQMDLAYQQLGHAYLQKKMSEQAIAALRRAAAISGPRDSAHLAYAYAATGRSAEARRILSNLLASPRHPTLAAHLAMVYAALGDFDASFRWLERGIDTHASFVVGLKVDPAFDAMHDDVRWARLLKRMGLTPGINN